MGGSSKQSTNQNSTSNQHAFNAGSAPYQGDIFPQAHNLMQMSQQWGPFHGDQVAVPGMAQQVAQHGAAPSEFIAAPHNVGTINAGVTAAQGTAGAQAPIIGGSYGNMMDYITGGPRNSFLTNQEAALQAQNAQNLDLSHSNIAQSFGSTGGVGSGNMAKALAFTDQANATSYNNTIAGLEAQAQDQYNQMQLALPGYLQGMNAATQAPIVSQGMWTDQGQENQQAADTNAYDQWVAQYQQAIDQAGQTNANTAFDQQVRQGGLDNAYLDWVRMQEYLSGQAGLAGQIGALYTGSGDQTQTGQQHTTSTTTESHPLWQDIAGLGGALMQGLAPGGLGAGLFGGSLKALGGTGGGSIPFGTPGAPPMPQFQWGTGYPSDRRLKKNIKPLGNGWYQFDYIWDAPGTNHIGVMADEVDPKFVSYENGYAMVDYAALLGVA